MRPRILALAVVGLLVAPAAVHTQNPGVTVNVDAAANRHAIDPLIYGVNFGDAAILNDLNATINRSGGNSTGRYNWQQNVDNRGSDYFFMSIPYFSDAPGELGDSFIADTKAGGAEPFLTMPMVGWVAKTNAARDQLWSFSAAKYPAGGPFSALLGDAGNGCKASVPAVNYHPCGDFAGPFVANDPNDASMPADAAFQQGWMQYVFDTWGAGGAGGLRFWGLDNEPSIWHAAYWDVHPNGADLDEIVGKSIDYASRIKTVDPTALVLGPEEWGWDGFFYSGLDQVLIGAGACGGFDCPDRVAHGGQDYVPYWLAQVRQYDIDNGQRIVDYLSLHFYPQGGEFADGGSDVTPAMQLLRNRSTRGLWDPAYVNESYINTEVRLIPRMKDWAAAYPGTRIALTEYNWGAENHINGATTQADLLGIFGREGLDMAIRWLAPNAGSPVANAFKMYRNYDGAKSSFGDTSVSATVPNPDDLAAFAAQRTATGALTIMVINKVLAGNTPTTVNLANFAASGPAQAWQLTSANLITPLASVPVVANSFSASLPPQSITLFVVPGSGGGGMPPTVTSQAATAIGPNGATLNGTVNPNGSATSALFDYGTTAAYGSTTAPVALGSGAAPLPTSAAVAGLACNTLYHFRARASNAFGSTNGGDLTFTTSACPPPPARVFVSVSGLDTNDCSNVATPCRTLSAAIAQVATDGEVIVIKSGSYAGATIMKSVKIHAAAGVVAFSGFPIVVDSGPGTTVVIRGLTLKAVNPGTGTGLTVLSGGAVFVERSVIDGWNVGIRQQAAAAELFVADSTIRNNVTGLDATAGKTSLEDTRLLSGNTGLSAVAAEVSLRGSTLSGNVTAGVVADASSTVTLEKCQLAHNGIGVTVPFASLGTVHLSRSVLTGNDVGLENAGGSLFVYGNNLVRGNAIDTSGAISNATLQ